jgi:hypothetical protein
VKTLARHFAARHAEDRWCIEAAPSAVPDASTTLMGGGDRVVALFVVMLFAAVAPSRQGNFDVRK